MARPGKADEIAAVLALTCARTAVTLESQTESQATGSVQHHFEELGCLLSALTRAAGLCVPRIGGCKLHHRPDALRLRRECAHCT